MQNYVGDTLTNLTDFYNFINMSSKVLHSTPEVLQEMFGSITNFRKPYKIKGDTENCRHVQKLHKKFGVTVPLMQYTGELHKYVK